jgi:hypothetical protein
MVTVARIQKCSRPSFVMGQGAPGALLPWDSLAHAQGCHGTGVSQLGGPGADVAAYGAGLGHCKALAWAESAAVAQS